MKNTNKSLKHLVLMDFSEASYRALKYVISISKLIESEIYVYHVVDLDEKNISESAYSTLQLIEEEKKLAKTKLDSIIEVVETENIAIAYGLDCGNMILKVEEKAHELNPQLIIIGKKENKQKSKGKLIKYLLDSYLGAVLIVQNEQEFNGDTKMSLGCNAHTFKTYNSEVVGQLAQYTNSPLNLVHVNKQSASDDVMELERNWKTIFSDDKQVQCEVLENSKLSNGIVSHVSKNKTSLLCLGRGDRSNFFKSLFVSQKPLEQVVSDLTIPVLIMETNSNNVST
jgi:nucleotide-binding universal stress UspA family protein